MLTKHFELKFNLELCCEYIKISNDNADNIDDGPISIDRKSFQTKMISVQCISDIKNAFIENTSEFLTKMREFQESGSGWSLKKISHLIINTYRRKRLSESLAMKNDLMKMESVNFNFYFF